MEEEDSGGGFGRTGGLGGRDVKEAVRAHTLATSIVRHLHLYRMKFPRFGPHNSPLDALQSFRFAFAGDSLGFKSWRIHMEAHVPP